jgi:hypothetical protein
MRVRLLIPTLLLLIFAVVSAQDGDGSIVRPTIATTATPNPTAIPTLDPALGVIDPSQFEPTTDFPEPADGALGPVSFPLNVNPLTGLPVDDPAVLQRRPIIAKISNAPALVRPQAGIGQADIVYEHYTEGGLTRLSAIFYTHAPTRVGSIRSARLIDYELTEMYKGLLAYSGSSIGVGERLTSSEFADRLYIGVMLGLPYYWRDEAMVAPHNMFTNLAAIWSRAAEQGFDQRPLLRGMAFHPDPAAHGPAEALASRVDIRYRATRVLWDWDPTLGKYRRTADGQPHYDAVTQQQITADNVVVLYAGHYLTDIIESEWQGSVSYSVQVTIWPGGEALLFRDGQMIRGQWVRASRPDLMGLRTHTGELLYLKPGNTWFQVVQLPEQMNPMEEWVTWE